MHIVYKILFIDREMDNVYPCYYIGSKSNSNVIDNKIIDKNGKVYLTSSTDKLFQSLIKSENYNVILLNSFDDYEDALHFEKCEHISNDVVANIKYFNKSIATFNNLTNPNYGSYRNIKTGKCARLPKTHELVLNGEYVNVNKGMFTYNDGINEFQIFPDEIQPHYIKGKLEKNRFYGEDNRFFGKQHTIESMKKAQETKLINDLNEPDRVGQRTLKLKDTCKNTFTGKSKSDEQKLKMSESGKGFVTLKHIETRECVRIKKEFISNYDLDVWKNPYALRVKKEPVKCPYCEKINEPNATFMRWHFENCKYKNI